LRFHPIWELRLIFFFFQDLAKCTHFEWLDELEGATLGLNLPSAVEQLGSAATVGNRKGLRKRWGWRSWRRSTSS
jgi:hypothetical protein